MQIAQGAPGACVPLTSSGGSLPIAACAVLLIERHIDLHFAKKFTITVEHLNSAVAAVANVDISLRIGGNGMRGIELARFIAALTPRFQPVPFLSTLAMRELMYPSLI